jgi:hypothetical protein
VSDSGTEWSPSSEYPITGQVKASATPEQPFVTRERPSYTPTIVVTLFFGLVGLWPAIRHSNMAKRRGYTVRGYWWAFGVILGIQIVVGILLNMLAFTTANELNAQQGLPTTPASAPAPVPNSGVQVPSESASDSLKQVVTEVSSLLVRAFLPADMATRTDYLNHVFACRDESCGYTQTVGQLNQVEVFTNSSQLSVAVNSATSTGAGEVTGNATVNAGSAVFTVQLTATWVDSRHEWRATSINWSSHKAS